MKEIPFSIKKYKKSISLAIAIAIFIYTNILGAQVHHTDILKQSEATTTVVRVIDGDTIVVNIDNQNETVRLIGIDTPETVDPRKPVQCFGKEASDNTKSILTGKTIVLKNDPTQDNTDKYGRLLRYVFVNGMNYNLSLVAGGYAHEYTYMNHAYEYQADFKAAQKEAKKESLGLWAICPQS